MKMLACIMGLVAAFSCFAVMPDMAGAATQNAVISWTDLPNETGYKVERKEVGGSYAQLGQNLAANVITFTDANLAQGKSYCWRVTAFNAIGDGLPSDDACSNTAGTPNKVGGVSVQITIQ